MTFVLFVNALILCAAGGLMLVEGLLFPLTRGPFLEAGMLALCAGLLTGLCASPRLEAMRPLHTFLLTASVWLTAGLAGALPLWLWGMSFTDAVFEAISGITTTGSTVMTGLDDTPQGILFWRAQLQWFGGVGFIVTGMALLPVMRVGGMQLFRTESSERGENELTTATRFASATLWVYCSLTAVCAMVYALGGMTAFEAVVHAMTTLSTGGFSTSDSSFGQFASPWLQWSGTLFMLAGGLPFAWYIHIARGGSPWSEQVTALLRTLAFVIGGLTLWRMISGEVGLEPALREVAFNVVSVVTTTGFATTDYLTWGAFAATAFFVLTAMGGCTGSTSGGGKMMRWILLSRSISAEIARIHQPHRIDRIRYEGRAVGQDRIDGVISFMGFFFLTFALLSVALTLLGLDIATATSGALTALANVGPGVGSIIGPAGTFAPLPDGAKWLLAVGMYVGRLEMLTVFVLLTPVFWREAT
ncbi:TrkH family potassium uptake protein [Pseudoroseicyclus aestuarii]|uniref:Trk system potassium uptake protein n=1 Tax=Pseudoroseicyclus aestuarii TaxID=1795041 RepID=A0A318SSC7_9RHOB|nr:TrkH family potassium uptake protein [Pseudoroseicyclus aestuarii]PYE84730.1 trk system potassium uptake protein TrkH [Pseudoroseicyclus aestuarii]